MHSLSNRYEKSFFTYIGMVVVTVAMAAVVALLVGSSVVKLVVLLGKNIRNESSQRFSRSSLIITQQTYVVSENAEVGGCPVVVVDCVAIIVVVGVVAIVVAAVSARVVLFVVMEVVVVKSKVLGSKQIVELVDGRKRS